MKSWPEHVIIAGGTGFIGSYLKQRFMELGSNVRIISRRGDDLLWSDKESLSEALENCDLLINLAGKSINSRFTKRNKQEIVDSRIRTTRYLAELLSENEKQPKLWINASGAAIYHQSHDGKLYDENSHEFGNDFLADVVKKWETAFYETEISDVRKVAFRTTLVLGNKGGAFMPFKLLTITGLGGKQGSGEQLISWIHIEDYFRMVLFVFENSAICGAVNVAAPMPQSNSDFMRKLRKIYQVPVGLPAPGWMLKPALKVIGVDTSLVLGSSGVFSSVMQNTGFQFRFPTVEAAFHDLIIRK